RRGQDLLVARRDERRIPEVIEEYVLRSQVAHVYRDLGDVSQSSKNLLEICGQPLYIELHQRPKRSPALSVALGSQGRKPLLQQLTGARRTFGVGRPRVEPPRCHRSLLDVQFERWQRCVRVGN